MAIWRFEESGVDYGQLITGEYDISIVTLSVLIACGAGYTALIVADRMNQIETVGSKYTWLVVGASAMGMGIWAMHFTGMLALMMDMTVGYSIPVTILSGVPAILGGALFLLLLGSKSVAWQRNQASAFCLASCIALMHYTGMEAMRMPSILKYDVSYFVLSIVVAHLLASLALYIKYHEFNKTSIYKQYQNIFSAGVLGLSVSGMHYTALGATRLYASDVLLLNDNLISNTTLIISVISIVSTLLVIVITVAYIDERIRMSFHTTRMRAEETLRESEERFRSLVENAPVCIHEIDLEGRLTSMNPAGLEMMGIENVTSIYGQAYLDVVAVEGVEHIRALLDRAYMGFSSFFQYKTESEGGPLFFESNFIPIKDGENAVIKVMGVTQDITAKLAIAEKAIKESEAKFLNIVEGSLQGIIVHRDFKPLFVNQRCADIFGYNNPEEILNLDSILETLWSPEERKRIKKYETLLTERCEVPISYECRGVRKDNSLFWFENNVSTINWQGKEAIQIAVIDITDRKQANEQLSFQASHDLLTGLVNRREFEHRAERLLSTIQQDNSEHALCFMDLDQFKVVNDTCSHTAGDELLRQLSSLLQDTVRHRDTLARLGGDEFGVLMEHCSLDAAHRVASSLQKVIQDYQFSWEDRCFKVGVSVGLVPVTPDTNKLTELLKRADAACYMAKDKGRNCIHVYHAEDLETTQRHGEMQWATRLNQALE
ncbi:MAG: diguanylate cyclase, partial [Gammaproteobacteria bacterium]